MKSTYNKSKAAEAHITAVQGGFSIIWKGEAGTRTSGVIYNREYAEWMAISCGASKVLFVATPAT